MCEKTAGIGPDGDWARLSGFPPRCANFGTPSGVSAFGAGEARAGGPRVSHLGAGRARGRGGMGTRVFARRRTGARGRALCVQQMRRSSDDRWLAGWLAGWVHHRRLRRAAHDVVVAQWQALRRGAPAPPVPQCQAEAGAEAARSLPTPFLETWRERPNAASASETRHDQTRHDQTRGSLDSKTCSRNLARTSKHCERDLQT